MGVGKDEGKKPIGQAYDAGDEIVILGDPPDLGDDVPDDDPRRQDCDLMGCGRAHVIYRFRKPAAAARISPTNPADLV